MYRSAMTIVSEGHEHADRFGEPLVGEHRSALWVLTLALSTCAVGAILFLVLVVVPSAGAAGGCGGA